MATTKYMSVEEFRRLGFLQEINRRMLHPVGLALEVQVNEETGEMFLSGIQDWRDEHGGIVFSAESLSADKARRVLDMERDMLQERQEVCGWLIQPIPKD